MHAGGEAGVDVLVRRIGQRQYRDVARIDARRQAVARWRDQVLEIRQTLRWRRARLVKAQRNAHALLLDLEHPAQAVLVVQVV